MTPWNSLPFLKSVLQLRFGELLQAGIPDTTRLLLENNFRGLPVSNRHDLDSAEQYALTIGTAACVQQAHLVLT